MNIQRVCVTIGVIMMCASLGGAFTQSSIYFPHSTLHIFFSFTVGVILLGSGLSRQKIRARNAALTIGSLLMCLAIGGFVFGNKGISSYGEFRVDEKIFVLIPRALEFETFNHLTHLMIGMILLVSFYIEKRKEDAFSKITVYLQTRKAR